MLSRLCSREGVKAAPGDNHEEILTRKCVTESKLEDDCDVFEREQLEQKANWKFIGDCAFLLSEEESEKNAPQVFDNVSIEQHNNRCVVCLIVKDFVFFIFDLTGSAADRLKWRKVLRNCLGRKV